MMVRTLCSRPWFTLGGAAAALVLAAPLPLSAQRPAHPPSPAVLAEVDLAEARRTDGRELHHPVDLASIASLAARRAASRPAARDVVSTMVADLASPPRPTSDPSHIPEFLPAQLRRDLEELRGKILKMRSRLFGRRGIVRMGMVEGSDVPRLRLNLQYDPDPGLRVVIVTP